MTTFENIDFEFITEQKLRDLLRERKHLDKEEKGDKKSLISLALTAIMNGDKVLLRKIRESIPEEVRTDDVFGSFGGVKNE